MRVTDFIFVGSKRVADSLVPFDNYNREQCDPTKHNLGASSFPEATKTPYGNPYGNLKFNVNSPRMAKARKDSRQRKSRQLREICSIPTVESIDFLQERRRDRHCSGRSAANRKIHTLQATLKTKKLFVHEEHA